MHVYVISLGFMWNVVYPRAFPSYLSLLLNPNIAGERFFCQRFLFFSSQNIVLCDWESEVEGKQREKPFHLPAKCTGPLGLLTATSKSAEEIFSLKDGM